MGAQLSTVAPTATVPIDAYIAELGDLTYSGDLGRSRFLKTVKAVHRDGVATVKVFIKPTTTQIDIGPVKAEVKQISESLRRDKGPLNGFPNAIGYSRIVETERAGYLVRQYIKHSLYDRISTRPFLEPIEKKWIAFLLLHALKSCHEQEIYHGDIKSENVLVGSWKWVYLADFAPFKPVKLPETDSAQFLFYFDVSQRRACYVAPERFSEQGPDSLNARMDIYSAGCVIAELFLDGQPLFSLADLFKYKRGEHSPDLSSIGDSDVQDLIMSMVSVNPEERLSAEEYLDKYQKIIFPDYFDTFWHLLVPFSSSVGSKSSDNMVRHLWAQFESKILKESMKFDSTHSISGTNITTSTLPVVITFPNLWWIPRKRDTNELTAGYGALIILSFVCSALTSTSSVEWRLRAAKLVLTLAEFVPDDAKLDRCLPYLVYLLKDRQPIVKTNALALITHLMSMVSSYSPLNEKVYTAYLFPRISQALKNNPPVTMRAMYAECIPKLAELSVDCEGWESVIGFIEDATRFLLVDKNGIVRRTLLEHADELCCVLRKQGTNDIILSHTITYLNDKDPLVRLDLFRFIAKVSPLLGPVSIEQYVVPLLIQSLCEPREDIVALVIQSLAAIVEVGLLRLKTLLGILVTSCVKFLVHPNIYIRTQTLVIITAIAKQLSKAQVYCLLRPLLTPYLTTDITDYGDMNLLIEALRPPISQSVYVLALQWASKAKKSAFWQISVPSPSATVTFSQEDRRWLARLREVGFNYENLWQLLAFKDYLQQLSLMLATPYNTAHQTSELELDSPDSTHELTNDTADKSFDEARSNTKSLLTTWKGGPLPRGMEKYIKAKATDTPLGSDTNKLIYINAQPINTHVSAESENSLHWSNVIPNVNSKETEAYPFDVKDPRISRIDGNTKQVPSVLIASIKAHRGAIRVLAKHLNNRIFVTAADDGVVKMWDARQILKGSSRPSMMWNADSAVTSSMFLGESSILVIGSESGKVSFLDCKAKNDESGTLTFDSLQPITEYSLKGGYPVSFHSSRNTLWVLISCGEIKKIDLPTFEVKATLEFPKEHGPPTCWTWSPYEDWFAVGTLHGMIELFDTRFDLQVNSWGIGQLQPITALEPHPIKEYCVCISGGYKRNLISAWNIQKVECCELLIPQSDLEEDDDDDALPSLAPIPATLQSLPDRFASWKLEDTFSRPRPPVMSLAASAKGGTHLLSGGGDKILRYWNLHTPHESSVICGTSYNRPKLTYMGKVGSNIKYTYETSNSGKSQGKLSRAATIGLEEHDIGRNHRGTILKGTLLEWPNGRDVAVSVDEVGVVKIFT